MVKMSDPQEKPDHDGTRNRTKRSPGKLVSHGGATQRGPAKASPVTREKQVTDAHGHDIENPT